MTMNTPHTYEHNQASTSTIWTVTHNLNAANSLAVDCWIDPSNGTNYDTKIIPLSVVPTSATVLTITFSTALKGRAMVAA